MPTRDLIERLGPLDFSRPWAETNAKFVGLRAALGGMATPVAEYTEANRMTRSSKVIELDEMWDQAAEDHPDPQAKPFFPMKS